MKTYKKITFPDTRQLNDVLIALLSEEGYDSFEEPNEHQLMAYIEEALFSMDALNAVIHSVSGNNELAFEIEAMLPHNWNETWEKSFQPIIIDHLCTVRAPFHEPATTEFVIDITPKMAFGTGHHATTYMMLSLMLEMDFTDQHVLDFGCGTGILSILASKKGAGRIFANDIEQEAAENAVETCMLNSCKNITIVEGGITFVPNTQYDTILANVNTTAIKENLADLTKKLKVGGSILLSGILKEHVNQIYPLADELNLLLDKQKEKDNWVALKYTLKK